MSFEMICSNCGGETNQNVCEHTDLINGKADKCYAKYVNNKWVKGCAYDSQTKRMREWVDRMCGI